MNTGELILTSMTKGMNDTMLVRNIKIYTKFTTSYFDASLLHKYNTINKNIVFSCCVKLTMTLSQSHTDWTCADPEHCVGGWGCGGGGGDWGVMTKKEISNVFHRGSYEPPSSHLRLNRNCLVQFRENPWNQTTDLHRGSSLITRAIT